MKFDVVSFGSAIIDAFVDFDFKTDSENIIIPFGSKILMKDLCFDIGGGGTNTAVAFSRLGLKTGYIGKIGNDKNGEKILRLLKKEKIKFLGKKIKGDTNGFSIILTNEKINRTILTYKGINDKIDFHDVKSFKTKCLYLSSLLGKSYKTQLEIAKKLKKKGTKIAFNPTEYLIKNINIKPLMKLCDIFILNSEEANLLTRKSDKLTAISEMGPRIVVITDGGKKVHGYDSSIGKKFSISAPNVKVVERTGTGDAFASGFVAGMVKNRPIEFCLKLGIKESAAVLKHVGAKNNLLRMTLR